MVIRRMTTFLCIFAESRRGLLATVFPRITAAKLLIAIFSTASTTWVLWRSAKGSNQIV
jgi:hypothetical protein